MSLINTRDIKPGSYQLHVFIEQTLNLISSSVPLPIIKIEALSSSKSIILEKPYLNSILWEEHIFLSSKIGSYSEFENQKLKISVYDYNKIGIEGLIGEMETDLVSIYFQENHTLDYQWAVLTNPKHDWEKIQGFIKFSAHLAGPGDISLKLEKEQFKVNKEERKILLPPQINVKTYQLHIRLIRAEKLIKMDDFTGSIDSYLTFQFGNCIYKTEPIKNQVNPIWGYNILLPVAEPNIVENLIIRVFDWDMSQNDEIVGTAIFSKNLIHTRKFNKLFWLNIYGSQTGSEDKEAASVMNANSELASFWKGRILMLVDIYETPTPKLSTLKKIDPLDPSLLKPTPSIQWKLIIEIFYGLSFPDSTKSYSLEIRWADQQIFFDKKSSVSGVWKWYVRKEIQCEFPYLTSDELPDVFLYLIYDSKKISFLRKPAKFFLHQSTSTANHFFLARDPAMAPKLTDEEAGLIKMRGVIAISQTLGDLSVGGWNKSMNEPILRGEATLFANIYQAQDLLPSDSDGSSDPYCEINYYGVYGNTDVVEDSLNPVWLQNLKIPTPKTVSLEECPPIIIKIYDYDEDGKKDFLGSAIVDVKQGVNEGFIRFNSKEKVIPKWINLKYRKECMSGKILIGFSMFDSQISDIIPHITPDYEDYIVRVKILGLRKLKSLGLLPVKRPFLKFDLNSIRSRENKQSLSEKKSLLCNAKDNGANPNFLTFIEFPAKLPKDLLFSPCLTVFVYDCIYKSYYQPVLGTFSINLCEFIEKTRKGFEKIQLSPKRPSKSHKSSEEGSALVENQIDQSFRHLSDTNELQNEPLIQQKKPMTMELIEISKKSKPKQRNFLHSDGSLTIVYKAEYEFNEKKKCPMEINIPNPDEFLPLGYDPKEQKLLTGSKKRHYRYYLDKPLEESSIFGEKPFSELNIYGGKRGDDVKKIGSFKGWVEVYPEAEKQKITEIDQNFFKSVNVIVRAYIISAHNLVQMDDDSLSDPYLKLSLNNQEYDDSNNYQIDKSECSFNKMFEFKAQMPGYSELKVQVWDKDFLVNDDLIGETIIDLENRFFNQNFRELDEIPIETRILKHPLSDKKKGEIRLFIEIIPVNDLEKIERIWYIEEKPKLKCEIRLVIWDVEDVPNQDIEGTSDLYVVGIIGKEKRKTDTHFRTQNGKGSFNWRMLWTVDMPLENPEINLQVFDKDLGFFDDHVGECYLRFENLGKEIEETENIGKLNNGEKVELVLKKKNDIKNMGKITVSMEIIPKNIADNMIVGSGRENPNHSPWLPPPLGRFEWTLNPISLFNQCIGLKQRMKIIACFCTLLCTAMLIYLFPIIIGKLIAHSIIS